MTTRGIRRKKSSLSEVKIAVIGAQSVGKSGKIRSNNNSSLSNGVDLNIL